MTQPATIYFGPDGSSGNPEKIFLRTLLDSTAKRGQIIDGMFTKIRRGESTQIFNIWVYGDASLVRGSGLYVGENGVAYDHHFLLPADGTKFEFLPGNYTVETYAAVVNTKNPRLLSRVRLNISDELARQLRDDKQAGLYFDWGPDSQSYHGHVRKLRPEAAENAPSSGEMLEVIRSFGHLASLASSPEAPPELPPGSPNKP